MVPRATAQLGRSETGADGGSCFFGVEGEGSVSNLAIDAVHAADESTAEGMELARKPTATPETGDAWDHAAPYEGTRAELRERTERAKSGSAAAFGAAPF